MDMCTLLYLKWVINKALLCSTRNPAQCYVAAWMGGEGALGENGYTCMYGFVVHLKLSQHCQLTIPNTK